MYPSPRFYSILERLPDLSPLQRRFHPFCPRRWPGSVCVDRHHHHHELLRLSCPIQALRPPATPNSMQALGRCSPENCKVVAVFFLVVKVLSKVESHVGKKKVRSSHTFERRRLWVRWPVVCVLSVSRPRLRRLRRACKPTASKNSRLITNAGCHLVGMSRCSPRASLRSAVKLRRSSGSCRCQYLRWWWWWWWWCDDTRWSDIWKSRTRYMHLFPTRTTSNDIALLQFFDQSGRVRAEESPVQYRSNLRELWGIIDTIDVCVFS